MLHIEPYKNKLQELCKIYKVKRLSLFGSALRDDFNEESDIDFLVEFAREEIKGSFDQYFNFKEDLEKLFNCKVDLVCKKSIQNPFFKNELELTQVELYAK